MKTKSYAVLGFSEIDKNDFPLAGLKGANLSHLAHTGFPVPPGFIVTAKAYFQFLRENHLIAKINQLISTINFRQPESLLQVSHHIQKTITEGEIPPLLITDITEAYHQLSGLFKPAYIHLYSSITIDDPQKLWLGGQHERFSNIHGDTNLLIKIKELWALLFAPKALLYRHEHGIDHFRFGAAVIAQREIEPEKSGIIYTIDPLLNDKEKILIEARHGMSDPNGQKQYPADHYEVSKLDLLIINKDISYQDTLLKRKKGENVEIHITPKEARSQKLTDNQILDLALLGKKLERVYYFPQEISYAIEKKKIYILQNHELTPAEINDKNIKQKPLPTDKLPLLLKGLPASAGIANGPVKVIHNVKQIMKVMQGDVVAISGNLQQYIRALKKASGLIIHTERISGHEKLLLRQLGIPAVISAAHAFAKLPGGHIVTVNGTKGEVYKGAFYASQTGDAQYNNIKTATHINIELTNFDLTVIASPAQRGVAIPLGFPDTHGIASAFSLAMTREDFIKRNVDGVGIVRSETLLADIDIHPKKLLREGKKHLYVDKLTEKLVHICKTFGQHPVVFCTSDFSTSDYRMLEGGETYEVIEANPLLGYRGSYRSLHEPEVFSFELEAIKKVREFHHLENLWVMLPFVRSIQELKEIKRILAFHDLHRSPNFKLWIRVDTPSQIILLDTFIDAGIDGISIDAKNLTMLMLGIDHTNSEVAQAFDIQDPSVLWAYERVIKTAHKHHVPVSFDGNFETSLLEKLIAWGITAITVTPDGIENMRERISEIERKIISKTH